MPDPNCLNIAPPPRRVPLVSTIQLLLGGPLPIFTTAGWMILGFGMIFFWIFTANSDLSSLYYFSHGDIRTAMARVGGTQGTGYSTNRQSVGKINYVFSMPCQVTGPDGQMLLTTVSVAGVSYALHTGDFEDGSAHKVQYRADMPNISRLKGCSRYPVDCLGGLFCSIFAMFGLGFLLWQLAAAIRAVRLLRWGSAATGKRLAQLKGTPLTVMGRPVMLARFSFDAAEDGSKHYAYTDADGIDDPVNDVQTAVLYDPRRPRRSFIPAYGPLYLATDEGGSLMAQRPWRLGLAMIGPAILAIANIMALNVWMGYNPVSNTHYPPAAPAMTAPYSHGAPFGYPPFVMPNRRTTQPARVDKALCTRLCDAVARGDETRARRLLDKGAWAGVYDTKDRLPLPIAAKAGNVRLVKLLLAHGACATDSNDFTTPLMWAARSGNRELAALLLKNGAKTETFDETCRTALHYAAATGRDDIAELLLAAGAKASARDDCYMTPAQLAVRRGHAGTARTIEHYSK